MTEVSQSCHHEFRHCCCSIQGRVLDRASDVTTKDGQILSEPENKANRGEKSDNAILK